MRAVVAGGSGQLGRALCALLGERAVLAGGRDVLDVRDAPAMAAALRSARPQVVFNASAFNGVDAAEREPAEAFAVNALGARNLAAAARAAGALLVHVSSDYVFDGRATRPYLEDDCPHPLSAYGVSKLAGEQLVAAAGGAHLIVRTSGLFGAGGSRVKGGSFVDRILARARAGEPLRVVEDQLFAPTWAPDLAAALVALAERGARGTVHVTNQGECSWHALALATLERAGVRARVEPIRTAALGATAARPAYSVLSVSRYLSYGLPPLRHWRDALSEHLRP